MTDTTANAPTAERLAGFPCWIELYTPDIDASAAFYRGLLGWEITRAEPGGPLTTEVHHDGRLIGSFEPAAEVPDDSGRRVSFMVDDVRAAAGAAERAGGSVVVEPARVTETMAYALASDPDGNVVGLLEDEDFETPPGRACRCGSTSWPATPRSDAWSRSPTRTGRASRDGPRPPLIPPRTLQPTVPPGRLVRVDLPMGSARC